jgi:outer membrane receptor protein involved in Fe transport
MAFDLHKNKTSLFFLLKTWLKLTIRYKMSWNFPESIKPRFVISAAGSASFQTNTKTAKVIIPSYTLLDASVFYEQNKFRIGFKVDNLTSKKAWSVRLTPQNPARFIGSISLKF